MSLLRSPGILSTFEIRASRNLAHILAAEHAILRLAGYIPSRRSLRRVVFTRTASSILAI
jgi:hypothetical protein